MQLQSEAGVAAGWLKTAVRILQPRRKGVRASMEQDIAKRISVRRDALVSSPQTQSAGDNTAPLNRLFMTSDLRAATGISRTHLDFYLREELVRPVARTESGYLLFDSNEVDLLRGIIDERRSGTPLKEIRRRIGR